jgi:hypothetical protein
MKNSNNQRKISNLCDSKIVNTRKLLETKNKKLSQCMVVHTYNPSTQEAEAAG